MSTPADSKWTRFSDAMPTGLFYCCGEKEGRSVCIWNSDEAKRAVIIGYTHWHPAPPLPEPPREETQVERDECRLIEWWRGLSIDFAHDYIASSDAINAWHAALAWERAEVAKLLPTDRVGGRYVAADTAIDAIRARVGGAQ